MALPNSDIAGLPQAPDTTSDDLLVVFSISRGRTEHVKVGDISSTASDPSLSFAWSSTHEYDEDEAVLYNKLWYISLDDTNTGHLPNEVGSIWWAEINRNAGAFEPWATGIYTNANVFVTKQVGTEVSIYKLISAVRPYHSTDLDAETTALDWDLIGGGTPPAGIDTITVGTTGSTITLDLANKPQRIFKSSADIAAIKTWALNNESGALNILSFFFTLTDLWVQTFPANFKLSDARWDEAVNEWTPQDPGTYKMSATYDGATWYVTIEGPFN